MKTLTKPFYKSHSKSYNAILDAIADLRQISEQIDGIFQGVYVGKYNEEMEYPETDEYQLINTLITNVVGISCAKDDDWNRDKININVYGVDYNFNSGSSFGYEKLFTGIQGSFDDDFEFYIKTDNQDEIEKAISLGWEMK